ncbi:MAG TPA: poly-gamma-glutamate biosynthesis protein PgsC/CapC, partial [Dissulfurispiraceae bacterium]|nr:poly-gamma-glutamate biosynthesis protein PgsC/CapC [Dissulfurispiraceae bacterium]
MSEKSPRPGEWALDPVMNDFVFPLFPSGLDSSVITTVWIGVIVVSFFTLRFGWVGSGLVVPGYVVPLLIVKPWVAAVILIESCITYFIVWTLSEYLSRWGKWSSLFGRDRFFALLLFSIIVKVLFDGWILPAAGEFLNETFHLTFDYRNNLHSFGLIIVALIANQFWKPGFFRGVIPLAVTVGISYAIVRFVLMEFTNFTISNLGYLYEDIAASILASPKAYIILLTTAFIASRMNLRYGWEFNGILVPSLVTLLWYNPQKVLVTFIESFIVLQLAVLVLRTPLFRTATIEGIRKILLFFHVSFAYKFALAYLMLWLTPETKITDFFGFGYLIPTLIAIKMHDTEAVARTMRVTVQTSLASLAVASIAGFALTFLPGLPSR